MGANSPGTILPGLTALVALLWTNLFLGFLAINYGMLVSSPAFAELPSRFIVIATSYLLLGSLIYLFANRKPAALALAGAVLAIGINYVHVPFLRLAGDLEGHSQILLYLVASLNLDSLMLPLLWCFAYYFRGQTTSTVGWFIRSLLIVSSVVAVFLIAASLLMRVLDIPALERFERSASGSWYWVLSWATLPLVYVAMYWKYRTAQSKDKTAYRYFFASLLLGFPTLFFVFGETISEEILRFNQSEIGRALVVNTNNLLLLGIPFVMAYSVLLDEDLSKQTNRLRFFIASALIKLVFVLPVIGGGWAMYMLRDTTVGELHNNFATPALLLCVLIFVLARRYESVWENYVKRVLYRNQSSQSDVLNRFSGAAAGVENLQAFVQLLDSCLCDALGVSGVVVESVDPFSGERMNVFKNEAQRHTELTSILLKHRMLFGSDEAVLSLSLLEKNNGDEVTSEDEKFLSELKALAQVHFLRLQKGPHQAGHEIFKVFELAAECCRCGRLQTRAEPTCQTCFGELQAAALPMKVGNLDVTRRIGAGAFGKVYEAVDRNLSRYVALKVLPPELTENSQIEIAQEGRVMAAFDHPHLARVYGIDYWRDVPFLVTELFQAGTLEQQVGNLSKGTLLAILEGLMQGLRYIHDKGVLHLDIKPSNIALSAEGNVKILDFGTSNLVGNRAGLDGTTVIDDANMRQTVTTKKLNGTPIYMCPEGLMGGQPDELYDFWSAAVSILELATGAHPFQRQNWQYSFLAISKGEAKDISGASARRLLSPKREERATDPEEIEDLIRQLLLQLP